MSYEDKVTVATQIAMEAGVRTLQAYWMAPTPEGNAEKLLELMRPPKLEKILDLGSGVGEVAELMLKLRPDLYFTLLNNNDWQLQQTPKYLYTVKGDMEQTGLLDSLFTVVMLNYSLGFCDLWTVLAECRRLLADEGVLFIWDLVGRNPDLFYETGYRVHEVSTIASCAKALGFSLDRCVTPKTFMAPLDQESAVKFRMLFGKSRPVAWRFCVQ
jgi:SAM-dependent methyltransferase